MTLVEQLQIEKVRLGELEQAYSDAVKAQSWQTRDGESMRQVTNQSISSLSREIGLCRKRIAYLERRVGLGRTTDKAVRVGFAWEN